MKKKITDDTTKDDITIIKTVDGNKNTVLVITGTILEEEDLTYQIVDLSELAGTPKSLRLDTVAFIIEGDLKCIVSYINEPYKIPFAGRGKLELDPFGGIQGHDLQITFKGQGAFFIIIDISKLGV